MALTWYPLLAMVRSVPTMFFGFAFPLVFIAVFGFIAGVGFGGVHVGLVGAGADAIRESLGSLPGVAIETDDPAELERRLRRGKIDGVVQVEGNRAVLTVNTASPQSGFVTLSLQSAIDRLNLRLAGVTTPPLSLEIVPVAGRQERYLDFALPGQIGMALLSTGIFGTVFGLIFLKKSLVLKRMFATPVRGSTILLGQGTARLIVALAQASAILAVGVVFFGFPLAEGAATVIWMLLLSILGLVVFLGFGLFLAGQSNSEEAVGPMTNLFTMPQILLGGTFFSTDVFPAWLRPLADNLPLSYLNTALRQVATEGADLGLVGLPLLGLVAWAVLAYFLAARTFRWY